MSFQFTLDDFDDYTFDEARFNTPSNKAFVEQNGFKNDPDTFAIIGCGGTISSAYSPTNENIAPTHFSPCLLYTSPSPRDKRQSRMPSSA